VLLTLAVVAAACASSSGGDDGAATPATDSEPNDTSEPTDSSEPVGDSTTTAPTGQNTASFRGVTADTVKVGVTVPDFEALQAAGLPNYQGDNRIGYQVFFDRINAEGGIHGRMIEPVYVDFDLLEATSQDAACVKLAEDEQVFIVLYGFIGENNVCLTDLHETMVMTHAYQSTEARDRSGDTVWLQLEPADDEKARILGSVVAEAAYLDDTTIGILANTTTSGDIAGEALKATLAEAGHDSTVYLATEQGNDPVASDNEMRTLAQRMQSDGVDFLFNLSGGGSATADLADAGFHPPRIAHTILNLDTEANGDQSLLDGALTLSSPSADDVWEEPDFRAACIDPILEVHPELTEEFSYLPDSDQQAQGERNWFTPTRNACNHTMLLQRLGEIAGAELTNDSFRAALDELGTVELYGYGAANFRSDGKWDGLDEFSLLEYDAANDSLDPIGEPITIDR